MSNHLEQNLKKLSNMCNDPREAYTRMRHTIKAAKEYIKKTVIRNMYSAMIKRKIGTNEVEALARRIEGRNRIRNASEVVRIMKKRLKWVEKERKVLKFSLNERRSNLKRIITNRVARKFKSVEREERDFAWKEANIKSKKKAEFAAVKIANREQTKESINKENEETKFYKVTDEELKNEPRLEEDNYVVYGDVHLSEPEKKCLNLGPKFMITPQMNKEDYQVEIEVEAVKTRMEIHKYKELKDMEGKVTESEKISIEKEDRLSREVFDKEEGTLRMSKLRVTDAKYNTRSYPPREADTNSELLIQIRNEECLNVFEQMKKENSDNKGRLKETNMTVEESQGKRSLMQKVKKGEIVITTTDKSGKFAVIEPKLYKKAAEVHLKDKEITSKNVTETETLFNRHAKQIIKSLQMGTVHGKYGQVERINQAFTSVNGKPGPIYFLIKDHKKLKDNEKIPPTRPVCSARGGPGARLSNLISMMINYAADATESETECKSTEEAMHKILETNKSLSDTQNSHQMEDLVVLSMDVKALYPSLKIKEVIPIIYQMIIRLQEEEKLCIEDVDWAEVGKYLAVTCSEEEIKEKKLSSAIPKRAVGEDTRGKKPGPAYWESDTIEVRRNGEVEKIRKWITSREPSANQKSRMLALMIVKAVEVSMKNHMYIFDGKIYKQEDGGPIGDELSQAVARLVMIWWDEQFCKKCEELNIQLKMYIRYVDDSNLATNPLQLGCRYENNQLVIKKELIEKDKGEKPDKLTARILKEIANTITKMIQMEEDVASNYTDNKLPILDLKVWLEKEEDLVAIRHEFFKKPMASKTTLRAKTAYPTSQLRSIMVEEVLRRMRNCHPDMKKEDRGKHITEFAKEMMISGHSEKFRQVVINKAKNKFDRQLKDHLEGTKSLYRSRQERERDIMKKGGKSSKDSWYRRKSKDNQIATSVLRIPYTTNSKLKRHTKTKLDNMRHPEGTKMTIVEGGGDKLKNLLMKPDPFHKDRCDRPDCDLKNCREKCYQGHVNYSIKCISCEEANSNTKYVYLGESSRGSHNRSKQHKEAYKNKSGFMWDHDVEEHGGVADVKYETESIVRDRDPMRRIIRESVRIQNARRDAGNNIKDVDGKVVKLMNRKDEWFGIKTIQVNFEQE